jgi:hypothetical protein
MIIACTVRSFTTEPFVFIEVDSPPEPGDNLSAGDDNMVRPFTLNWRGRYQVRYKTSSVETHGKQVIPVYFVEKIGDFIAFRSRPAIPNP